MNVLASDEAAQEVLEVAVIGTGFSGLGMAIKLKERGEASFAVFEKADDLGGTWRDNVYPGCGCDVPSHLYSYSFALDPSWTRHYAAQPEILTYLKRCAQRFGLHPHLRFRHEVTSARFDEEAALWRLSFKDQPPVAARFLVLGMGALHRPALPEIKGRDSFKGAMCHSAQWTLSDEDLRGKRVAVIGTGASAIQLVPQIAPVVGELSVFQRTPPWVLPKPDKPIAAAARQRMRVAPALARARRYGIYWLMEVQAYGFSVNPSALKIASAIGRSHLKRQVPDEALRERLTPGDVPGCKRILLSNDYYPALSRPNVRVHTEGIASITEDAILTRDGARHEVDVIIFGTGFKVTEPMPRGLIFGLGGQDIMDAWSEGVRAYKGVTVSGFPNMFILMGPNTGLGHNSMVFMIEAQISYALRAMDALNARQGAHLDVTQSAQDAYHAMLQPRLRRSVWGTGCQSWYLDDKGDNPTVWPGFTVEYWWRMSRFDPACYEFTPRAASAHAP